MSNEQGALVREAASRREPTRATASRLGISLSTLQNWRRNLGVQYPKGRPPASDYDLDTTPGCVRCGLRGEHACLAGDAAARRGDAWQW